MKRFSPGLRLRLFMLALFTVLPAFLAIGYAAISEYRQAAGNATKEAMHLVKLAAREQGRLIDVTRSLLVDLSQLAVVTQPRAIATCNQTLGEAHKSHPYYTTIGAATLDGNVFCNARPLTRKVNVADRSYFRRTVQSHDFGIGDYQIGRATGEPAVNFGYPFSDAEGRLRGIVYAALSLTWLEQLLVDVELPPGSALTVVDSAGTVLAHYPGPEMWVGKSLANTPLGRSILGIQSAATAETADMDGVNQLYAFAPLHQGPGSNVYVAVGIPTDVAFADANHDVFRYLVLLLVVAALALITAWFGSRIFVLRRVNALADAAHRLGKGDLSARTGLSLGRDEFGQLAHSFDDMAATLQRVNRARKTLSSANRALIRATDEHTLLEEMCRVVVEVGGYPFAWIGYAEHDENKTVRPVAQFGFDGDLRALASWVTGISWADTNMGRGAVGTAIRSLKPYVAHNFLTNPNLAPWSRVAIQRGFGSCAAFPLCLAEGPIGALAIYSRELDGFDTEELELLEQAAHDLAFGIVTMRTRLEHEQARVTIHRMAHFDRLTGLPNHAVLEDQLRRELTDLGTRGHALALLVIDLNRLHEINDALGFNQGDLLIKEVGTRIRSGLPDNILVARLRGDEFSVLSAVRDANEAASSAQRILDALKQPFSISGLDLDVGATVGISLAPQHGTEASQLVRHADIAVQQAKKLGKSYVFYAPEHDQDGTRRLSLAGELRRAIEGGELVLHYQPKVEIPGGRACGAEALVRWNHPDRGMIRPDEFISLAEHTGLIKPMTDWVIAEALRQSAQWRQAGLALPIAVNLSARNLHDTELVYKLDQLLASLQADGNWLEFEITEGAVMDDPDGALKILTRLSDMGVKLYIDDFGTGYSSLAYLKKLPVDAVKIDKSFVMDVLKSLDSAAIVRSTIDLAHDLDLKVVAEGVETDAILDKLSFLGCDVAQGYHFGKPLPAAPFKQWHDQRARSW